MGDSLRERVQMVFEKGYMLNWITKVFTIVKVQYQSHSRIIAENRWSARVASRYSSGRVSRGESIAPERRQSVRQVARIRMDRTIQ